jgi:hypothetical protein
MAEHPLEQTRRRLLLEAERLDDCRLAYLERGDVYASLSLERELEYLGESLRIMDKLLEATT